MNEQQIRAMVREEIHKTDSSSRFQLTSIPRHIHNGIDSPLVYQQIQFYTGEVLYDISNAVYTTGDPFPRGFTVELIAAGPASGGAEITHNLGSFYTAFVTPLWDNNTAYTPEIVRSTDSLEVIITDALTGSIVSVDFLFLIVVVNSTSQTPPSYI